MMFILCLHNHQPEGTPEATLDAWYRQAYWPTLRTIAEHPAIRMVIHHSGCLLENLILRQSAYLDLLQELVSRGQVELLSSPIYEPILPAIPEGDQVAQIRAHHELIERTFGVVPRGLWLPERVWEPSLPKTLAQAGVEYLPLDDTSFLRVGLAEKRLYDSYVTEDQGMPIRVFPVPQSIRQIIPAGRPEEAITQLVKRHASGARVAVFADDGEKFGAHRSAENGQQDRWLSRFFSLLEQEQHRVQTCTFAQFVDGSHPASPVYLPTGAYSEILEWSIPAGTQRRHHRLRTRLIQEGDGFDRMLGMGCWRNFLVRYPEANWMHKRGLDLYRRLQRIEEAGADPEAIDEIRRHLWKAQCHDAYWHGVTGGLYLPHLRAAVHSHQITAWRLMDHLEHGDEPFVRLSHRDLNLDAAEEVVIENRWVALTVAPADGGTLVSLDLKEQAVNLLDNVARREEAYHRSVREGREDGRGGKGGRGGPSWGSAKADVYLNYDPFPLHSLRDHFVPTGTTVRSLQELRTLSAPPARTRLSWERGGEGRLTLRGSFRLEERTIDIERSIELERTRPAFRVLWRVAYPEGLPETCGEFATEWTLGLDASDATGRYIEIEGEKRPVNGEDDQAPVSSFRVVDEARGVRMLFTVKPAAHIVRHPVDTVSISSAGPESVFQGSRLVLIWPLDPAARELECALDASLEA